MLNGSERLVIAAAAVLYSATAWTASPSCYPRLPNPELEVIGSEDYDANGQQWTRFLFKIANSDQFLDILFEAAPNLPPCGLNKKSSRTWMEIFDQTGARIYGNCGLTNSDNLNGTWFAIPRESIPPAAVYITLRDRLCGITYTSNSVAPQLSPALRFPLPNHTPESVTINSYFDHSMSRAYTADGSIVTYNDQRAAGKKCSGLTYKNPAACSYGGLYYDGHPGYDLRTKDQSPDGVVDVLAAASGNIEWGSNMFNTIYIVHPNGYRTAYLHLSARLVANGTPVIAGQIIGRSGDKGAPGSPHLHFEVNKKVGKQWIPVDPYGWRGCPGCDPYGTPSPRLWK